MQSKAIIDVLNNSEATSFIHKHMNGRVSELALQFAGKVDFNLGEVLQLIKLYKKAKSKLPLFVEHTLALEIRAYEQSTSQEVASYKARLLSGNTLVDFTGGIGVDSMFLSKSFETIDVFETNIELHLLACYNLNKLGITNVNRIAESSEKAIRKFYDWGYIDPDRRVKTNKAVALSNMEPDVMAMMPVFQKHCKQLYIKLSPLFDLAEIWKVFSNVKEVIVIAERDEVKEVGVVLSWGDNSKKLKLYDVYSHFKREYSFENSSSPEPLIQDERLNWAYLHLANSLLTKTRMAKYELLNKNVKKHPDFLMYFSEQSSIDGFRTFRIKERSKASIKSIKKLLKKHHINQLNLIIKGSRDQPIIWHSKLKTSGGGNDYLFILLGEIKEAMLCSLSVSSDQ